MDGSGCQEVMIGIASGAGTALFPSSVTVTCPEFDMTAVGTQEDCMDTLAGVPCMGTIVPGGASSTYEMPFSGAYAVFMVKCC